MTTTQKHSTLILNKLTVCRKGYYGSGYRNTTTPDTPFEATIEIGGAHGKVELDLGPELSAKIVAIVADEVAAAGRATAEIMTADALLVTSDATPALAAS